MTLTHSPMKISEAAHLAALLKASLVARPGRLEMEATTALAAQRVRPIRNAKPVLYPIGA